MSEEKDKKTPEVPPDKPTRHGGRQKGTPNKRSLLVASKLVDLGCDPIQILAEIAMDTANEAHVRVSAAKELARKVYPDLKAIEIEQETTKKKRVFWGPPKTPDADADSAAPNPPEGQ